MVLKHSQMKVSVLVPVYNAEYFLPPCLDGAVEEGVFFMDTCLGER